MNLCSVKSLLVAVFSTILLSFAFVVPVEAQDGHEEANTGGVATEAHGEQSEGGFDPGSLIMGHISDSHDFHFFDWNGHPVSMPLPVILYSPQRGFSVFSSSRFEHGHAVYEGYKLVNNKVVPVAADGSADPNVSVYNFSITKNVFQMFLALIVLVWMVGGVAAKYRKTGSHVAPTGLQNALEPVVTFIRDEVGKVCLGRRYEAYMPLLLTIFFFILINSLFGLLPGSANVVGNIAFTIVLGIVSFVVILFSTNKYFWGHIFNPHVPGFVKPIMVPVEILGIFTKPFALIVRLFANMIAGHIVITCFVMLIFIFGGMNRGAGWGFTPVSVAFTIFIYLVEILVAFVQAFIFTNLTAVFIGQAIEGKHDGANDGHEDALII